MVKLHPQITDYLGRNHHDPHSYPTFSTPLNAKALELLSDWKKAQALECKTDFVLFYRSTARTDVVQI